MATETERQLESVTARIERLQCELGQWEDRADELVRLIEAEEAVAQLPELLAATDELMARAAVMRLQALAATVEHFGQRPAAEICGISQATVSRQLSGR